MRRPTIATLLATSALAAVLLVAPRGALAQVTPTPTTPAPASATSPQAGSAQAAPVRAIPLPTANSAGAAEAAAPTLKVDPSQLPAPARAALGQTDPAAKAPGQSATPTLSIDVSKLPALPPIVSAAQRDQMVFVATGAGAAIGLMAVDLVTGGLLLAPLGVPSAVSLVGFGGAAVAAPTYSVAQRVLAGVASVATAVAGGYIGRYLASSRPDLIGLQE
jgi:hypothetical protein